MTYIFKEYPHNCSTSEETFPPRKFRNSKCYILKKCLFSMTLASPNNCLTVEHISSESQINAERRRHYNSKYYFTIHPLSNFAAFYDFYTCVFYMIAIFVRLMDVAFIRRILMESGRYETLMTVLNILDMMSWGNVMLNFFCGEISPNKKDIIIDLPGIFWYRLKSYSFWGELLSSVPKCMICSTSTSCTIDVWLIVTCLRMFVILLVPKPIRLLKQSLWYIKLRSRTILIIIHLSYQIALVTHVMACTGFAISRYRHMFTGKYANDTWILYDGLINKDISIQYSYAFFKASAQIFGITIEEFQENETWEENVISILSYVTGKIMMLIMWVAILNVLLSKDLQEIRFQEIIAQLNNWMDNKELPKALQKRIIDYYNFYYRKRFFSNKQVQKVIPESLKSKIKASVLRTLKVGNIALFEKLNDEELQVVGECFVTEVYSPNDVIIYSGLKGDSLYLLASGTVAVYTHSGKEVCHLQDGAYFGELALLLSDQRITATIKAIETTKVYRIPKKYFQKYVLSKQDIYDMFMEQAESRLQAITKVEDDYRRQLFAEMYKGK